MKSAVRTQYGGPAVLNIEDRLKPQPGPNQVLVKIYATTINRTDCAILKGQPFILRFFTGLFKPNYEIPGTDFAGEVVETGSRVTDFETGDRVFGLHDNGLQTQSQFVALSRKNVVAMPDNITYAQGAASLEGAHYAYNFINKVKIKKGATVLVNGATGAIGSAMVQWLHAFGATITAVCPGTYADAIRERGAERIIDFTREDFTQDTGQYDFVFDTVGKSTFGQCKAILKPKGVYISSELGPGSQNVFLSLITPFGGGKKVKFPFPTQCRRSVLRIKQLIESGRFKPLIDRSFPLSEIRQAYAYVMRGQKIGNVILQPHES